MNTRNIAASKFVIWAAISAAIPLAAGCSDIFGFQRSDALVQCVRNSDCPAGLSCLESVCTIACRLTADCTGNPGFYPGLVCENHKCVPSEDAGVAVGGVHSGNETGSDAPATCRDVSTDVNNCGLCGHVCEGNNATWKCAASECIPTCNPGWADCDGDPSNGCETDIAGNAQTCGSCQKPDSSASVCESDVCINGSCAIADVIGGTCTTSQAQGGTGAAYEANTIVGGRFWSQNRAWVTAIGINTWPQSTTQHAYLAIYTDSPEGPRDLIGPPEQVTIKGEGTFAATVSHSASDHTELSAGTWYWLMAVSDQLLAFERCSGATTWAQGTLAFGAPPAMLTTPTMTSIALVSEDTSPSIFIKIAHPQ